MSFLVVGLVSFFVAGLTLFTGFGLGTMLVATFVFFFPVDVAISATAVVHIFFNLFKVGLLYREAVHRILVRFGIPAVLAAFVGAAVLASLSRGSPLLVWHPAGREAVVTPLKLVMGVLILGFAILNLAPALKSLRVGYRWLPLGGVLAGFFGGLSGHQGAFRAAFLSPLGLKPAAYVGTQAVLAIMVDAARLLVYGLAFFAGKMALVSTREQWTMVAVATLCAFGGAYLGYRLLRKATVPGVRLVIGILLLVVGLGLATGII